MAMKTRLLLSGLGIGALALAAVSAPVLAQALRNHNSNAPVDVEADRIEVQDRADRAVFSGNVQVRQGGLALDAARLTVAYAKGGSGDGLDIQAMSRSMTSIAGSSPWWAVSRCSNRAMNCAAAGW